MDIEYYPTTEELYEKFGKETVNGLFADREFNTRLDGVIKDVSKNRLDSFEDWNVFDTYSTEEKAFAAFMFIERWHVKQLDVCARLRISGKTYRKIRDDNYNDWINDTRRFKTQDTINARNVFALSVLGKDCPA